MHFLLKMNLRRGFSHCSDLYKVPCKISAHNIKFERLLKNFLGPEIQRGDPLVTKIFFVMNMWICECVKKHLKMPDLAQRPYFGSFFMISQATDMLEQNFQQFWTLLTKPDLMIPIFHIFMTKNILVTKGSPLWSQNFFRHEYIQYGYY